MANPRYGLIGVGALGQHFASRLLEHFAPLSLYDVSPERLRIHSANGGVAKSSPAAVARCSDIVLLSVPDPQAVENVIGGADGVLQGASPGALVIDTSSIDPATSKRMFATCREQGVGYLEAPMTSAHPGSTGVDAARLGTFTVLVGGSLEDLERAKPVLEVLGNKLIHLGPAGSASVMKLISNQITGIAFIAIAEGLALAAAAGFSVQQTLDVLSQSCARSYCLEENVAPRVLSRDYEPGFSTSLMGKDHQLAAELAEQLNIEMPLNRLAVETYQRLTSEGRGRRHCTDVVNWVAEAANVDLYAPGRRQQ
jgi:3-hydroxyisobutyrate dehydrogenase